MVSSFFRIPRLVGSVTVAMKVFGPIVGRGPGKSVAMTSNLPPIFLGGLPGMWVFFLQALHLKGFSFCYRFM